MNEVKRINLDHGTLTDKDKARIQKDLKKKEQTPSTRQQSYSYQFFQEQASQLGNPYDVTRIPISVLKQMQRDPMIAFGLHFIRTPIANADWYIKCERADIAAFVDNALRRILHSYISQRSQSWNFGFAPMIKNFQLDHPNWTYLDPQKDKDILPVWPSENVEAIVWKNFTTLPSDPTIVEPKYTTTGEFNGIKYNGGTNYLPFTVSPSEREEGKLEIDIRHALWITNEKPSALGSLYGYPRVGYAYRYWWSYWFRWALYDRFFERKSDPPYVVYYPTDQAAGENEEGDVESMKAIALGIGESARAGGVIALPGQTITGYEDRPTSIREWEISELPVQGDMSHFVENFEYLDVMKLRALWIPEQALMEGAGGTSSRNVAAEEIGIHKEGSAVLADEIDDELNRFVIPDLVAANFPDFNGEVRKITTGFAEADQKTMQEALRLVGTSDITALRHINVPELLDRLGMPRVSHSELLRQEEEAKKALEDANPPVVEPVDGEAAGVTPEGLYVQQREVIRLAEDKSFKSTLPGSKHYKDKQVITKAQELRKIWKESYANIYDDFIKSIENGDIKLDEAFDKAEDLVNKWLFSRSKLNNMIDSSKDIIKDIIGRAGDIEIEGLGETWDKDSNVIAEYLEERGLQMVSAIDETVKNELKTFLANLIRENKTSDEIIKEVRSHFSDYPDWKANRLVRSEIRDSYNFATITAGKEVGIKVVQARDAQLGDTDPECMERDGKFFNMNDALTETFKEHPNGTLEWILIPDREDLSIRYVEDTEKFAWFDDETNVIYFNKQISIQEQKSYLHTLGDLLGSIGV